MEEGTIIDMANAIHGEEQHSKLKDEVEEMWTRCGEGIDSALSQLGKTKLEHFNLGIALNKL